MNDILNYITNLLRPFNARDFQHPATIRDVQATLPHFISLMALITRSSGRWGLSLHRLLWGNRVPVKLYIWEALIVLCLGCLLALSSKQKLSSVIVGRFLSLGIQDFTSHLVGKAEWFRAAEWRILQHCLFWPGFCQIYAIRVFVCLSFFELSYRFIFWIHFELCNTFTYAPKYFHWAVAVLFVITFGDLSSLSLLVLRDFLITRIIHLFPGTSPVDSLYVLPLLLPLTRIMLYQRYSWKWFVGFMMNIRWDMDTRYGYILVCTLWVIYMRNGMVNIILIDRCHRCYVF